MSTEDLISGKPCSLIRRLAVMFYDAAVVVSLLMLATGLAMLTGFGGRTAMKDPFFTGWLVVVWFLYLAWCWRRGMTVGMRAWGVRVENENGGRPGWGQSLIRFIASLLSAAAGGMGFLWSLVDRRRRTWHDFISRTRLVRD